MLIIWIIYWQVRLLPTCHGTPSDDKLIDSLRLFTTTFSSILGAIILISIVLPWFLIAVIVIVIAYIYAAAFYRASARELKVRLQSLSLTWVFR